MAKSVCIIQTTNSANIEKLGQYRKTRPIQKNSANTEKLCHYNLWPWINTADLGPVTGPIRNNLINNFILLYSYRY